MFHTTHATRTLTLGGLLAVAAIGTLAAPAQAASKTANLSCELPYIGATPVTVTLSADLPATVKVGQRIPPIAVTSTTTLGGNTRFLVDLVGATTIEGLSKPTATITAPGITLPLTVPLAIPQTPAPIDADTVLTGTGATPSITFNQKGTAAVSLTGYSLKLLFRYADGQAIQFEEDDTPEFDVPCAATPGQNTSLGSFKITK